MAADPSPSASSDAVRARMVGLSVGRDTSPEVALRRSLRERGVTGYRIQWRLPGELSRRRADIAWPGRKLAVFVDGCFWHGCPDHHVASRSNAGWWRRKIEANRERDRETAERLVAMGWRVVRVWEHQVGDPSALDAIERQWREST